MMNIHCVVPIEASAGPQQPLCAHLGEICAQSRRIWEDQDTKNDLKSNKHKTGAVCLVYSAAARWR